MVEGTESARVEQCDRDVAAAYYYSCGGSPKIAREIREGKKDDWFRVKAFAWHRLAAIEATGWQPIETAPKNEAGEFLGPDILIYYTVNGLPWPAYWGPSADSRVDGAWISHDDDCREFSTEHVTHWMPLPAAPNLEPRHD